MAKEEAVVALALLTQTELTRLGQTFARFCPLEDPSAFDKLLEAIDQADEAWARNHER